MIAESFFLLFILVSFIFLLGGLIFRSASILALSGVLFMMLGLFLMAGEPIEHSLVNSITITDTGSVKDVDMTYKTSDISNNFVLELLHYVFFYGSFAVYVLAIVTFLSARKDTYLNDD